MWKNDQYRKNILEKNNWIIKTKDLNKENIARHYLRCIGNRIYWYMSVVGKIFERMF